MSSESFPDIVADTQKFLHALSWGAPALTGYFALRGLSEGLGLTRPTMYFGFFGLVLLTPLGYVLMYGGFGLSAEGALGLGLATAIVLWMQLRAFATYLATATSLPARMHCSRNSVGRIGARYCNCCAWACQWVYPC